MESLSGQIVGRKTPARASGYATWGSRVGAALIDGLLVLVLMGICISVTQPTHLLVLGVAGFLSWPAYFTIGHGSALGQTFGKKALGIAVREAETGGRIGYGRAFYRWLIQTVLGILPVIGLGNLLAPLWTKRKQAWHDSGARTVVLRI